jgi:hypothetical protein
MRSGPAKQKTGTRRRVGEEAPHYLFQALAANKEFVHPSRVTTARWRSLLNWYTVQSGDTTSMQH